MKNYSIFPAFFFYVNRVSLQRSAKQMTRSARRKWSTQGNVEERTSLPRQAAIIEQVAKVSQTINHACQLYYKLYVQRSSIRFFPLFEFFCNHFVVPASLLLDLSLSKILCFHLLCTALDLCCCYFCFCYFCFYYCCCGFAHKRLTDHLCC